MELFPAGSDEKWRLIQRVINECDYYVLVVGGKYGSIDPNTDLSYTEMEYDYADSIGKPVMAFLHGESGKLTGDQLELSEERRDKLDVFRDKVESARVVKYWTTAAELPGHVALALMEAREHYPAEGWVRASQALTPETRTELAELRARVAELTQIADARESTRKEMPADLAQGDDLYLAEVQVAGYKKSQLDDSGDLLVRGQSGYQWTVSVPLPWDEILQAVGPSLLHEVSEPEFGKSIQIWLAQRWSEGDQVPNDFGRSFRPLVLGTTVVEDIIVQFLALGLVERGTKRRTVSDRGKYWVLTALGEVSTSAEF